MRRLLVFHFYAQNSHSECLYQKNGTDLTKTTSLCAEFFVMTCFMMNEQIAVQSLLRRKLIEFQAKNPSYSVRAFARRLGMQPAATNEIIKGERRVSRKIAEKIILRLQLDPTERASLLKHFPVKSPPKSGDLGKAMTLDYLKLTADQFELISDWVHFAILNLIKTPKSINASEK